VIWEPCVILSYGTGDGAYDLVIVGMDGDVLWD